MFELNYYNQSSLWKNRPEEYQVQLLADILSIIPVDTESILDVGCGNGLITNSLPETIDVVGLDCSEEALKTVNREKKIGSIVSLPFADNSFDLVMANDIIEHLSDDIYLKGVAELFRVASKYVLISVPHGEQLEKLLTKCAECNCVYHVNHHQRSYKEADLIDLCPQQWKVNEIRFSGDITRPPLDPIEKSIRIDLEGYLTYDNCLCPACGSSKIVNNHSPKTKQILGNLRSKAFYNLESKQSLNKHINRSEIIALYKSKVTPKIPVYQSRNNKLIETSLSPFYVNFNNPLQSVKQGFVEGCFWSKFRINDRTQTNQNKPNKEQEQSLTIHLPLIPERGDKIVLQIKPSKIYHDLKISLLLHDDLNNKTIYMNRYIDNENCEFEFFIEEKWQVNLYGAAISIETTQEVQLESLQYISIREKYNLKTDFIFLKQGHNILFNYDLDYYRSWGLFVEKQGYYPKPNWLWSNKLNELCNLCDSQISLKNYKDSVENILSQKDSQILYLLNFLEQKEWQRANTELAYAKSSQLLTEKELERAEAERTRKELSQLLAEKELLQSEMKDKLVNLSTVLKKKELESSEMERQITSLLNKLEQKELEGFEMQEKIANLLNLLEQKEWQPTNAELAYAKASKFQTFFSKNTQRQISKILVLSHMFPNQTQLNSGCFVAEQVKALREFEDLDVRVVSCQPFWCNTKNPLRVSHAIRKYQKDLDSINWFLHDQIIPTLFVPYLVGKPFIPFHLHGLTYRSTIVTVAERIWKTFKFDLVHAHTGYLDGFAGLYLSKRYKVPLVITEHTNPFSYLTKKPLIRQITLNCLKRANLTIAVSSALREEIKNLLPGMKSEKLLYVPNGFDSELFKLNDSQIDRLNNQKKTLQLLSIIALEDYKNPFCLLEAFKILCQNQIDVKLTIVGQGSLLNSIEQWISNYEFNDLINIMQLQPRNEVARLMREECDIFVLPSRSETFGVVVIEALASGKPVVTTRCGGPESILREPYLGELCENDNAMALAKGIEKVNNNYEKYPANHIQQFAVKNYSFKCIAEQLNNLYQNI